MNKLFVIIGVIIIIGGGFLAMLTETTTIDETMSASEDIARIFLLPDVPLQLPAGETVISSFDVTGTPPERDILVGITANSSLDSVLVNSHIVDETFTAEGFFYYDLGTAEADEGGLFTFSWSVDSGTPVFFGVFDTEGYLTATSILTIEAFENNALVWDSLSDGIGYLESPHYDDYFFLLLNTNANDEEVTVEVFMVTLAAIPYLDSTHGTTQVTFTYDVTSEDDYRLVVELPDGAYDVNFHSELAPEYPYQMYGFILLLIGAVIALAGFLVKTRAVEFSQPI